MSLRTSDRCHWCGNPYPYAVLDDQHFHGERIPTPVCGYFFGMTFLIKEQFMSEQFLRTEMLLGSEAIRRLQKARVAVFGLGGVGGYAV